MTLTFQELHCKKRQAATPPSLACPSDGGGDRSPQLRLLSRPRPDIGPSLAASSPGSACAPSAPAIFCPGPAARPHRGFFSDVERPERFGPRSPRRNRWRRPRRDPRFSPPPPFSLALFSLAPRPLRTGTKKAFGTPSRRRFLLAQRDPPS